VPVVIVVVLLVMLAAGAWPRVQQAKVRERERDESNGVATVFTEAVTRDTAASALELPGSVAGLHETPIHARTNGFVRALRVDLGSSVRAGDTLLVLDMPDITEQSRQARAALEQVEATAQLARATLARWRALAAQEAVTKQELDEREAAANVAEAAVRAARANVANLTEVLRFGALTAPFSGVVTARNVDIGALVSAGAVTGNRALLTLTQTDTLRVMVSVPQSAASRVRIGQRAAVSVRELGNASFAGRVALTARAIDPVTRTLLTEVHVVNPDRRLLPGMFANVSFNLPATGAGLRIPAVALIIRADGPQVARVENDVVRLTPITLGRDFGSTLEVVDGIEAGAQVIVNPSESLATGDRVRAVKRGAKR
jgi:RND family efflux transporter MFP subunit